jgi:pentatricopeptide repeat protein
MLKKLYDSDTHFAGSDINNIGTLEYGGHARYWNSMYKGLFRNSSLNMRIRVHRKMLKEGLVPGDISNRHFEIIMAGRKNFST